MDDSVTLEQAKAMASLTLALMRQLAMPADDLAAKLPLAQLRVCAILYGGPRPMSALSRDLGVSQSAMTQIADRLERARLVKRVPEETDRRVRCLELTPRGERVMRLREDARTRRALALLDLLSPQERAETLSMLEMLADASARMNGKSPPAEKLGSSPRAIV